MAGLTLGGRLSLAASTLLGRVTSKNSIDTMNAVNAQVFEGGAYSTARRSKKAILQAYQVSPWLRAVVGKLYDAFTAVEWSLYGVAREGKYVKDSGIANGSWESKRIQPGTDLMRVDAHPYYEAVDRGASLMSAADLYGMTQVLLELYGECFWWKLRGGNGVLSSLLLVPPQWVSEVPGRNSTFVVQFPLQRVEIQPGDMVWFKTPAPVNPYDRGEGLASVVSDELEADEFAAKHVKSWFINRARPDIVVSVDARSREERNALETAWRSKFEGWRRAHRVLFMNKGAEIKEISQSFKEMELTDLRKFERDVVLNCWGYPPEIFGIVTNSNRATINSAEYLFARWILVPRLEYMRKVIQSQIISEFDKRLVIGFSSPVAKDSEYILKVAQQAPWSRTIDEWRALQGLSPLEDDAGQVLMVPANMVPVPATSEGYEMLAQARSQLGSAVAMKSEERNEQETRKPN